MARNNFPKSVGLWDGAIVPAREVVIKDDPHGFEKIRSHFFPCRVDPGQDIHGHLQSCSGFCFLHEVLGDGDRVKHHALAGPRDVRKQPMLDGVVFGAVRWVMRHADFQPQPIGEFLQGFLEHMVVDGVAATAITEEQQTPGVGIASAAMPFPPMGDAVAT